MQGSPVASPHPPMIFSYYGPRPAVYLPGCLQARHDRRLDAADVQTVAYPVTGEDEVVVTGPVGAQAELDRVRRGLDVALAWFRSWLSSIASRSGLHQYCLTDRPAGRSRRCRRPSPPSATR